MYKAEELILLEEKPRINDIDLYVLCDFYEMFLLPFVYTYYVVAGSDVKQFRLRFDRDKLCHLLGVESIAKGHVKYRELSQYKGNIGWKNIKEGKLNFGKLKSLNKSKFKSVKAKFVYFYLVPSLIEQPMAVLFDGKKVDPPVNIECEVLFYSKHENAVVHLGIDIDDEGIYFPRTFFVEKLGHEKAEDIYTINQTPIKVVKDRRIILL